MTELQCQGKLLAQQSATQLLKSITPQWLLGTVFSFFALFWHEKQYFLLPLYFSCKLVKSSILPGGQKSNFSPTPIHQLHTLLTFGQQFCTSTAHALQFRLQWSTTSPSTWNFSFPLLLLPMPAGWNYFFPMIEIFLSPFKVLSAIGRMLGAVSAQCRQWVPGLLRGRRAWTSTSCACRGRAVLTEALQHFILFGRSSWF